MDAAFAALAGIAGKGAAASRAQALGSLFARATRDEQDFLRRLVYGELRQGAQEGVLVDAVARAASVTAGRVRRQQLGDAQFEALRLRGANATLDDVLAEALRELGEPGEPESRTASTVNTGDRPTSDRQPS